MNIPFCEWNLFKEKADRSNFKSGEPISVLSWDGHGGDVAASFEAAHSNDSVLLVYNVFESDFLARFNNHNDPVYQDSCVEFFINFEEDSGYYNFEFNSLGTCLAAYGSDRNSRERLSLELIDKIDSFSTIKTAQHEVFGKGVLWQLQLKIPVELFCNSQILSLAGKKGYANFYKCGDDLPKPHFYSWKKIGTPEPDFHQPDYFGDIEFE
ncbi:carbohydrate-binding family 9-like protein [Marinilabiliaceae bacterium ANBcel2]|nr:carbohydrate-binding family 9-like protein [Marinilabiliaceae bacterium ANBcel2]